jgi:hypothetical protein
MQCIFKIIRFSQQTDYCAAIERTQITVASLESHFIQSDIVPFMQCCATVQKSSYLSVFFFTIAYVLYSRNKTKNGVILLFRVETTGQVTLFFDHVSMTFHLFLSLTHSAFYLVPVVMLTINPQVKNCVLILALNK